MRLVVINLSARNISGGYEEYLNQFFEHATNEPGIEAVLFVAVDSVSEKFRAFPKVEIQRISKLEAFLGLAVFIKNKIINFRPDIIYVPMEKRLKNLPPFPVVTMVQNMEPFAPPVAGNSIIWRILLKYMKRNAIDAINNSAHVISLSNFACKEVIKYSILEKNRVSCIPHGFDINVSTVNRRPKEIGKKVSFLFTAGTLSPSRGLDDLIKAFIVLKKDKKKYGDLKLCIAGEEHRYSRSWLNKQKQKIKQEGLFNEVFWLGFINREEIFWCLEHALAVVLTSRIESFCITAAEAMIHKSTVISSNSPCLPETLGSYATYYESGNSRDLAKKLKDVLGKVNRNSRLLASPEFTWDDNFAALFSIFNKLYSSNLV